ncbi:hypothetical protein [Rhizobium sp. PL01]|uniref:hypothetical protein n=1 Tax=Rhizobium sp. PL01 TaxID=3085631 RepID=UPI0029819ACF|nr:hypothetical protein [Rhizobium sp. PL01]MDW5315509.1 hypothetical protein [Rhizobium sp. PL01]
MLPGPKETGPYRDRDIDCQEALQSGFRAVTRLTAQNLVEAAGGKLSPALINLAKDAARVGWGLEEAETAISELAQNYLDDLGE